MTATLSPPARSAKRTPNWVRRHRRLCAAVVAVAVVVTGWVVWSNVTTFTMRKTILIHGDRQQVWADLTDLGAYRQWNPFMISAAGEVRAGATLRIKLRDVHGGTMTFSPRVEVVRPGRELRWVGHLGIPGIVDGEHDFLLADAGPGTVRLTQQETFSGVVVPFLHGYLDGGTLPQFANMNRALANLVQMHSGATGTLTPAGGHP